MAINGTLELIQTVTVPSGGQGAIEFTSIPNTYDDLYIVLSLRNSRTGQVQQEGLITFNGTSTGYSERFVRGNGSATLSGSGSGSSFSLHGFPAGAATASTFGSAQIYISNYKGSVNKSVIADFVTENNATESYIYSNSMLWSNSAAITSIKIDAGSTYTWVQHSTAYLYGVTRVPAGAKATGGVITETDTHWVHTFTSSGVFTPNQNLTCDYLVVAGGGGGSDGAGGGAGGMRCTVTGTGGAGSLETPLSLSSGVSYTVTVGAGGTAGPNNGTGTNGSDSVFSTITAAGGGNGGRYNFNNAGSGGSGGGGGYNSDAQFGYAGGIASPSGQGFAGGSATGISSSSNYPGSGGGGASQVGANALATAGGAGGNGRATDISGTSVTYAGGGGGGIYNGGTRGLGGTGGGGNGGEDKTGGAISSAGAANTGGGGGGGSSDILANALPRAGGSGIVIVRYAK